MEGNLTYFEFYREFYNALKLLPPESIGKIVLILSADLFNDSEMEVYTLTAEEEAILILLKDFYEISDRFIRTFN